MVILLKQVTNENVVRLVAVILVADVRLGVLSTSVRGIEDVLDRPRNAAGELHIKIGFDTSVVDGLRIDGTVHELDLEGGVDGCWQVDLVELLEIGKVGVLFEVAGKR